MHFCGMEKYLQKSLIWILSFLIMPLASQAEVLWLSSGALQPSSASFRVKMDAAYDSVRVLISMDPAMMPPYLSSSYGAADTTNNLMVAVSVSGLQPDRQYYYAAEANGQTDISPEDIGSFHTPDTGAYSFNFVVGSCNRKPDTETFRDFLNYDADFYLSPGDLHYADPCNADISVHRNPYESRVFNQPLQAEVYRRMGFAYVWDDHDYCGNDANGSGVAGAQPARRAYREYIPHYALQNDSSIYQAFDYGRVRFILSDLRSERKSGTTTMGTTQKAWFKQQLLDARDRKMMIAWVGSYSWYGIIPDNWGGEQAERRELCEFFRDSAIANMFILNGDAHMVAVDDGRNGDFTSARNLPYRYPVFQAAPVWNNGSWKGGTYSEGQFFNLLASQQQYGVVRIDDQGRDSLCITFDAYQKSLSDGSTSRLVTYSFCRDLNNPGQINTGLNESAKEINAEIFPNPVTDELMVKLAADGKTYDYSLLSQDGRLINRGSMSGSLVLKTDKLPAGVYILQLDRADGARGVFRIVK
jgi:hypothetical protein